MERFSWPFASPALLTLLTFLPLLVAVNWVSARYRRKSLARFAQTAALLHLTTLNRRHRARSRLLFLGAVMMFFIALAGPRWGKGDSSIIEGRDLVIVLDLSKSMLTPDMRDADHPARWQAAQIGLRDLVQKLRQKGGHRLGLVVFAAKAWPVCPLTADYDHFLMRLNEFSPNALPVELQPMEGEVIPSGTRIGAGIMEGIKLHDERFPGYQDQLLISDGDDPADDRKQEIEPAIQAALNARIPIYVVGIGDPKNEVGMFLSTDRGEELVSSQLQEPLLKEIAARTKGEYYSSERSTPNISDFVLLQIDSRASRELPDDALPQPREQYAWFLVPGIVLLLAAWWLEQ